MTTETETKPAAPPSRDYRDHIEAVAGDIAKLLQEKDQAYGGSWQRRGGVGAYMMLVRKSDRLEEQVRRNGYDIFEAIIRSESALEKLRDTLMDQIGYGILILAEMRARGIK